jgi:hypothetical protein
MKYKLSLGLLFLVGISFAQTKIEKNIPVQAGQKLVMNFDYPELIKVQTWDQDRVLIRGDVSINRGENDDAFDLQVNTTPKEVTVTSILKNKESIPQRIMIKKGGTEYYFKARDYNDPEVQKFLEENGREYTYMSNGVIKEIELEIFIPKNIETVIDAKYGLVEVKGFEAPLTIFSKYGGIDASIISRSTGEIIARTRYGEILTNLDIKFNSGPDFEKFDKWTEISARPGTGPRFSLESKYGKVYLRKPVN